MGIGREFELIEWVRRQTKLNPRVPVGIGDDAAVLLGEGHDWLATVDMLVEGVHFDLSRCRAEQVGRKAMGVNLSDIAAMAGEPVAALVAIGVPPARPETLANDVMAGIGAMGEEFGVVLVGGDTNRSPGGLVVSVTLLGHPTGRGPVLRRGALPGDALCVTGRLGYSLAGRHMEFTPRVREAQSLHANFDVHAMIDVSDGLGRDVFHLVEESGCGVVVDEGRIPIADSAIDDGRSPLDHAMNDGEDFELLFVLPEADAARLIADPPFGELGVTIIGEFFEGEGVFVRSEDGERKRLTPGGFAHEW